MQETNITIDNCDLGWSYRLYKYGIHLTPGLAEVSASGCRLHLLSG